MLGKQWNQQGIEPKALLGFDPETERQTDRQTDRPAGREALDSLGIG